MCSGSSTGGLPRGGSNTSWPQGAGRGSSQRSQPEEDDDGDGDEDCDMIMIAIGKISCLCQLCLFF